MPFCTAPVRGHERGSKSESDCPLCGALASLAPSPVATKPPSSVRTQGEIFWVEDSSGTGTELVGGEFCEDARFAFKHGQCLGLASVLASRMGTDMVAVSYDTEYEEEYIGDGEVITHVHETPIHVWAKSPDESVLIDFDGENDKDIVLEELEDLHQGARFEEMSVGEAKERFSGYMNDQNYAFAETFVDGILEGRSLEYLS